MARTAQSAFITVRSEGGLLPPDLLARIATSDSELGGLAAADYGLPKGVRLTEAAAQAWAACKTYWEAFKAVRSRLGENESGVTETREQWVLPLFRELGYGRLSYHAAADIIDERSYPISHRASDEAGAPPIHVVAVAQDLDRGEGKRTIAGGLRVSPQGLMQEYLNRTPHLWGIVTNGRHLRLLRDNASLTRAAYVEFNLEAMMEGGVYADFVLLYLVLHRSRLPRGQKDAAECWLERWRVAAVHGGTRALDALRDGVTAALKAVGQGLVEHPENEGLRARLASGELSVVDYYRQLLRLVYRLLFLLVAEERGLLFQDDISARARTIYMENYSVSRLRDRAERRRRDDRHDDLWRALQMTFALMRDGCEALGLRPLSGGLFNERSCPDLDGSQLANAALVTAIRGLSLVSVKGVRRHVNYRDLNVEELGSVYESLLELHPTLRREGSLPQFELVEGSERKTTGSYYTPPQLVGEVIKNALEPVIARALADGKTSSEQRQNVLDLTVCDPACGSGHFLLAAARRLGREVARLDAGEMEPDIETLRQSIRLVIQHCIYGVDVNPLAVDLCRLALWIEGHLPGRPLTFLDHRVKCGNSLIGATPEAVAEGLPDGAFTPLSGDDRAYATSIKKRHRTEQAGQSSFFNLVETGPLLGTEASEDEVLAVMELGEMAEANVRTLREKEERYEVFREADTFGRKLFLADAWTAAFFWRLQPGQSDPPTAVDIQRLRAGEVALTPAQRTEVRTLAARHRFFHWSLEFPDVFADPGGFDCVVGNPPWERIKLQEQEFFAARSPEIATAPNAAARKKLIVALPDTDPALAAAFTEARQNAETQSKFVRESGRFALTAVGDVNTYALFAEQFRKLVAPHGRAGLICPTGIATDDTTKRFFGDLVEKRSLISFLGFKNEEFLFSRPVEHTVTFGLLTMVGTEEKSPQMEFTWLAYNIVQMNDAKRRHFLTAEEIALVNPNTHTCPVFRTRVDAELTKAIYRRQPVLMDEATDRNSWGVRFMTMYHMANDSVLFRTREQLEGDGLKREGNIFCCGSTVYLPLYEAKLLHQFDHRWATYDGSKTRDLTVIEKRDPWVTAVPRYWVLQENVEARLGDKWTAMWLLGFRDIARNTDERTSIFSLLPRVGVGHKAPLVLVSKDPQLVACLMGNANALVFDYITRQKLGGTSLSYFILKQLPTLSPDDYTPEDIQFIVERVLELIYTAWDLRTFANDLSYEGPPFSWNEDRRAVLRAELDAYYARLYSLTRKQLRYILDPHDLTDRELDDILDPIEDPPDSPRTKDFPGETFRVLKEREIREYGEYRTKRLVLEAWDRLSPRTTAAAVYNPSAAS